MKLATIAIGLSTPPHEKNLPGSQGILQNGAFSSKRLPASRSLTSLPRLQEADGPNEGVVVKLTTSSGKERMDRV